MIKVSVSPTKYKMKITGHANSAPRGADVICASVSYAFYNLCQMMLELEAMGMLCNSPKMKDNEGNSALEVVPKAEYEAHVQLCFMYFAKGIEMLDSQYPEFVSLKITKV